MNELQRIFNYHGRQVRTVTVEGEPYFVAKDVCDRIGLDQVSRAMDRLDSDEVALLKVTHPQSEDRLIEMNCVNEAGLYQLILASNKPEARQFKRWVTHEVLPAIRKHGLYATDELLNNPDFAIRAFTALKEERERNRELLLLNAQKQQIIHELQPKATYYDLILQNKSIVAITKIAKDYGMSGTAMNAKLHELGVQYKQGNTWLLYQKYADKGYTQSKTHIIDGETTKFHTYWTQKGRLFLYDLLKQNGILPMIERDGLKLVVNK